MIKNKSKFIFHTLSANIYIVLLIALALNGCDNGSDNSAQNGNAYVTMSIAKQAPGAGQNGGNVRIQQLENVTSIIITASDGNGYSASGDIWKNNGNLTLSVKPHTQLTISGVAYEGTTAAYAGQTTVGPLSPGTVANIGFSLNPITPPAKPVSAVSPSGGAVGIPVNTAFSVDLSNLSNDIASIDNATLNLSSSGGAAVTTDYIAPDGGFALRFTQPSGTVLDLSTLYTANLVVNYTDNGGATQTVQYNWSFTTTNMSDPDLAQCVYDTMQTNGFSSYGDIIDLNCSGDSYNYYVKDLQGMEVLTNLQAFYVSMYCDCSGNFISDLSPLSGLARLDTLDLSYNLDIANLAPITGFANLKTLSIAGNNIVDVSPWAGLTNLVNLDLSQNNLSDINSLSALNKLQNLDLSYTYITDLSPLSSMTGLRTLDLSRNNLADISTLPSLANLQSLNLYFNRIVDLSPLSGLVGLQSLNLASNQITALTPLSTLSNLQNLDVSQNQIADIAPLSTLSGLQTLNVSGNLVSDVSALNTMTGLVSASLSNNNISTVSLDGLANLTSILFNQNKITSFNINGAMPMLGFVDVSYNFVTGFHMAGTAADYPSMIRLYLQYNNITDISDVAKLPALQYLVLDYNNVQDVSSLQTLTALRSMSFNNNNVSTGVQSLAGITGSFMNFANNPDLPCTDIQSLDQSLDNSDGGTVGNVQWTMCFTDSALSSLVFPDQNLANCVNQAVTGGGLANVSELTSLSCPSAGITDISGLGRLVKLQDLDLSGNFISSFTEITYLRDLTTLNLSSTGMSNINALAVLRNVQNLYLDSNPFTSLIGSYPDYPNIGRLTHITTLSLTNNNIASSLQSLATLFNALTIDLTCSPTALSAEITALDQALDGGDGAASGVVRWGACGV